MNFQTIADGRGRLRGWLDQYRNKSGGYVIREQGLIFKRVLYVGESHTDNLKRTMLRHFQKWTGKTSGPTYPRTKVEVAVIVTSRDKAVEAQNERISELSPRDNVTGQTDPW